MGTTDSDWSGLARRDNMRHEEINLQPPKRRWQPILTVTQRDFANKLNELTSDSSVVVVSILNSQAISMSYDVLYYIEG